MQQASTPISGDTNTAIAHRRLLNQHIAGARFDHPEEVVTWMGAMQAQEYQQALWAVGLRMRSATQPDIEQAIANRKIVRTWPMRGTLHFISAENVRWMLELSASRRLAADRSRRRQLELDESILARCWQLFHAALQGGRSLPRSGMLHLLEDAHIDPSGQRGYHILWYLAQTSLICLGPRQGNEQTFVLLDEWVPTAPRLSHQEALARLATCYFASHGPATLNDFAGWSGITLAEARAGLEAAKPGLVSEQFDAKEYWEAKNAPAYQGHELYDSTSVYLLPGFDEYLLGYKDRSDILRAEHARKAVPGGNGIFLPIIVVGGQVTGTWKRTRRRNAVDVTVRPFTPLDTSQDRLADAAQRFSDFIGSPLASMEISDE